VVRRQWPFTRVLYVPGGRDVVRSRSGSRACRVRVTDVLTRTGLARGNSESSARVADSPRSALHVDAIGIRLPQRPPRDRAHVAEPAQVHADEGVVAVGVEVEPTRQALGVGLEVAAEAGVVVAEAVVVEAGLFVVVVAGPAQGLVEAVRRVRA
jgi:hypothetical protein